MAAKNKSNEIHITRVYDAPVKMVWEAWVDPKQVAKWWGPRGFTLTTRSKDVREGGTWDYTMHGPDGTDYENLATYHVVEKYKKLVYDHGATRTRPPLFRVTVLFTETNGKTKMEMSMALPTPEEAEQTRKFIKQAGGDSTWDRLAEYLASDVPFVINRTFAAPRETVFKAWTDPKHSVKWSGPTGFTMEYIEANITPGGVAFYSMSGHGMTMYGKARYRKVQPPEYLEYTQEFSDKDGNISRHPMAPTWPAQMLTKITFTEEGPDQTRVTLQWEVFGESTQAERDMFQQGKAGMSGGWGGSFDKLDDYLTKM